MFVSTTVMTTTPHINVRCFADLAKDAIQTVDECEKIHTRGAADVHAAIENYGWHSASTTTILDARYGESSGTPYSAL